MQPSVELTKKRTLRLSRLRRNNRKSLMRLKWPRSRKFSKVSKAWPLTRKPSLKS